MFLKHDCIISQLLGAFLEMGAKWHREDDYHASEVRYLEDIKSTVRVVSLSVDWMIDYTTRVIGLDQLLFLPISQIV